MRHGLESLLRLLDSAHPADASGEEFDGPCGETFRVFQRAGFLATEPAMNPALSCPHCVAGTPYILGGRYVCNRCRSTVDRRHLQLWRFDLEAFLRWFAREQALTGGVEGIDEGLWRLGTFDRGERVSECFFLRGGESSALARRRLAAFRSVLILHGRSEPPRIDGIGAQVLSIIEALTVEGGRLVSRPLSQLFAHRRGGIVHFDRHTGVLLVGDEFLGQIPSGTREFALIDCLWGADGAVIPYADLKRAVSEASGSSDTRDEATYCHRLKSRLKKEHGIAAIDQLIRADRLGGGYMLVREVAHPRGAGG